MNEDIIKGWEPLSRALCFYDKAVKKESNKRQFFRIVKKYNLPLYRQNNRVYMFKEDIETINRFYLFGIREIAEYIGIHVKTLYKWLKRYPKMPVDRERKIAFTTALDLWYATLIFDYKKRGRATEHFNRGRAPIMEGLGQVLYALDRLRLSHPKALKPYGLGPQNDILKTFTGY